MSVSDIRLKIGFLSHPKTKKLKKRLGSDGVLALISLFLWVAANRPNGDLSGFSAEDIELAADWDGEEGMFVKALVEIGFLEQQEGSYGIHDWEDHNPWASGAEDRSAKGRWNALCKHHGKEKAAELMPEYAAERVQTAAPSKNSKCNAPASSMHAAESSTASSMHDAENSSAPYPYPSTTPSTHILTTFGCVGDEKPPPQPATPEASPSALPATDVPSSPESAKAKKSEARQGTRLSEDWALPDGWGKWALKERPGWTPEAVRRVAEQFRDYWCSKAGASARKANWEMTWRNWVRNQNDLPSARASPRVSAHIEFNQNGYGASGKL